jgi:protein TonB
MRATEARGARHIGLKEAIMTTAIASASSVRSRGAAFVRLAMLAGIAAVAVLASPAVAAEGTADTVRHYRQLGAQHLYDTYRARIFKGQLPPLLYAIAIIDVDLDADGRVVHAVVDRPPAAAQDVVPWILGLIHAASPFPRPLGGPTRYRDIWLVDQSYTFQLDTLTEGQR